MKVKCKTCNGTGLYRHWTCKKGEAQECATCKGTGYQEVDYEPFITKELVSDINIVVTDAFGCMNAGSNRVPYEYWIKK